jgi:hypothetical protein
MDLLILGATIGLLGGMLPNPVQMIALTQVALGRWARALFVLVVPLLIVDSIFFSVTLLFYQFIPLGIAHYVAYVGGSVLIVFASHALWELRRKTETELANSASYTFAGVVVAMLAELASPNNWIYWVTIAGPILAEGRARGFRHVAPFFVGGLVGYYSAAVVTTCVMAWGAGLHKAIKQHLVLAANVLLLLIGISYLVRAYLG